jgi:bis(5'-nucleosyl)-tetraphosphatase (symmetrical)
MSTYVIGDLQGCIEPLYRLLDKIAFDPEQDQLWFAGDLVNRGPDSLATLRFVHKLGKRAQTVLGNHDLHALAVAEGVIKTDHDDNLQAFLSAEDRPELCHWLRQQPLLHHDAALNMTMIHAGLPPQWDLQQAMDCAHEVESVLQSDDYRKFLSAMYGNRPARWTDKLTGIDRLRIITNALTRLRYCEADGTFCLSAKGPIGTQPEGCQPWFQIPDRRSRDTNIVFGHWSTLGPYHNNNIYALDSGCLWGGYLTALRLQDKHWFSVNCNSYRTI